MSVRGALWTLYWKAQKLIAPGLRYSQSTYEDVLTRHVDHGTTWLDIGCGHQILPSWRAREEQQLARKCKTLVGLDYDLSSLAKHPSLSLPVRGSITELPFRECSFDLVTANMVVEHLDAPDVQLREVHRVLKPEGIFLFHTPNALGHAIAIARILPNALKQKLIHLLDGREEEDVFETHYKVNTRERIVELARTLGFDVIETKMFTSTAAFHVIPPLAILELIWIRILMTGRFESLRPNIIAIWRKPFRRAEISAGSARS